MEHLLSIDIEKRPTKALAEANLGLSPHLGIPTFIKGRFQNLSLDELLQIHAQTRGKQDAVVRFEGRGYRITYVDRDGNFYALLIGPAPK